MPGLVGIYDRKENIKKNIKIGNLLLDMCSATKHKEWYKTQIYKNQKIGLGRVTLGILNPEIQPIYNEDKSLLIMMEGEIFDYQNYKEDLIEKEHKFTVNNDPEFVLHFYEELGEDFVHELNGSFLIAIYDIDKDKLLIVNDRLGSRSLYYSVNDNYLIFGSEIKVILEHRDFRRILNKESVVDFFTYGFILNNKTFFKNINLLPYASILRYGERLSIKNYWELEFKENYEDYPDEYYIKKLQDLLINAVKRQIDKNHKLGVSLSGGFDSRTIAGIIKKIEPDLNIPLMTFAYDKNCVDVKIAKLVADKLNLPHYFIQIPSDYLVDYLDEWIYYSDGALGATFFHCISTLEEMKKHSDILFLGTLLDSMFHSSDFDKFYNLKTFDYKLFVKINYRGYKKMKIKDLFTDSYLEKFENDKSFKEIEKFRKIPKIIPNKWNYYEITQAMRRLIFDSIDLVRKEMEIRMPFLDNDLIDFYLAIPPRLIYKSNIISRTFKLLLPEMTKIPLQSTNAPVDARDIYKKINDIIFKISILKNKILARVNPILISNNKRDYYDYDNWIRKEKRVKEFFTSILLDEKTLSRGYFKPESIKKLISMHMSGKNCAKELGLILTFELWNRKFIDH